MFLEGSRRGGCGGKKTYDQSALVLGFCPLQADKNVLVDQILEERPRVDGDEVHLVVWSGIFFLLVCDYPLLFRENANLRRRQVGRRVGPIRWVVVGCFVEVVCDLSLGVQKYCL